MVYDDAFVFSLFLVLSILLFEKTLQKSPTVGTQSKRGGNLTGLARQERWFWQHWIMLCFRIPHGNTPRYSYLELTCLPVNGQCFLFNCLGHFDRSWPSGFIDPAQVLCHYGHRTFCDLCSNCTLFVQIFTSVPKSPHYVICLRFGAHNYCA